MVAEGVSFCPVVDAVFNPTLKSEKIVLRISFSYLISPFSCDKGFLTVVRPKEFFTHGKNCFLVFELDTVLI